MRQVPRSRAAVSATSQSSGQACAIRARLACRASRAGCAVAPTLRRGRRPRFRLRQTGLTSPMPRQDIDAESDRDAEVEKGPRPDSDVRLVCRDCRGAFAFTEDERRSFATQGYTNTPSRCPACREVRKLRQSESGMRQVSPGFRELRQTRTSIVCTACGETASVPFAARAGRAVYCSTCFRQRRIIGTDA
jgi:CxxC-x17-CxxC domain-containing protein